MAGEPYGVVYVCRHCGRKTDHIFRLPSPSNPGVVRWLTVRDWSCSSCFERRVAAAEQRRQAEAAEAARAAAGAAR